MKKFKELFLKNKTLFLNIIGSYLIKGLALIISFFTLPSYIQYFRDNQVLGVWFTLLSILQWILIFDFGLGNGLRNRIVPFIILQDHESIRKYISSSYYILGLISILALILGISSVYVLNWNEIFNISTFKISLSSLRISILIVYIGIIGQFFLKTILSILYAMKKVALSNFIALFESVIVFAFVLTFRTGNLENDLLNLSLIKIAAINIPLILVSLYVFRTSLRKSSPKFNFIDKNISKDLVKLGGKFFYIQITLLLINSTNEVLIAWFYGPSYVVEYSMYYRLFYLSVTFFSLLSNPIWSEVSVLVANQNYAKISMINKKIIYIVFFTFFLNLILLILSQNIFNLWLGKNAITVNIYFAGFFVFFSFITIYNMSVSIFANAYTELRTQIVFFTLGFFIKLPLILVLNNIVGNWITIIIASGLSLLPYSIAQTLILRKRMKL
jgi:O-antigen/teichoic acid export membrane protein